MWTGKRLSVVAGSFLLAFSSLPAHATPINFTATGVPGVTGFVQFDDASFNGTADQRVSNVNVTDLSITVFGEVFTLAHVVTSDDTIITSTGVPAIIVNGAGNLADNGSALLAFFPDGFGSTPLDGDASLAISVGGGAFQFHPVAWVASPVPEPTCLMLLVLGSAALGFGRRPL